MRTRVRAGPLQALRNIIQKHKGTSLMPDVCSSWRLKFKSQECTWHTWNFIYIIYSALRAVKTQPALLFEGRGIMNSAKCFSPEVQCILELRHYPNHLWAKLPLTCTLTPSLDFLRYKSVMKVLLCKVSYGVKERR